MLSIMFPSELHISKNPISDRKNQVKMIVMQRLIKVDWLNNWFYDMFAELIISK